MFYAVFADDPAARAEDAEARERALASERPEAGLDLLVEHLLADLTDPLVPGLLAAALFQAHRDDEFARMLAADDEQTHSTLTTLLTRMADGGHRLAFAPDRVADWIQTLADGSFLTADDPDFDPATQARELRQILAWRSFPQHPRHSSVFFSDSGVRRRVVRPRRRGCLKTRHGNGSKTGGGKRNTRGWSTRRDPAGAHPKGAPGGRAHFVKPSASDWCARAFVCWTVHPSPRSRNPGTRSESRQRPARRRGDEAVTEQQVQGAGEGVRDVARSTGGAGVIEDVAVLDLTHIHAEEDLAGITRIKDVATVLVRESLTPALGRIPMEDVAEVVPVPEGARIQTRSGTITMGGEALADAGGDDVVLLVTGSLVFTSRVTRVGYREVIVVGMVVAPQGSESALGAALTRVTGSVDYFPYVEGQRVKAISGQTSWSGEALANRNGTPGDVLVATGQLVITSPVTELGYQDIFMAGQLVAPRESGGVLAPVLTTQGQVAWYSGREPRLFVGEDRFARAFFELLHEPETLVLIGSFQIEDDVAPDLLRQKVREISLIGKIEAPKSVVPVLQLLAREKYGEIAVLGDEPQRQ